MSKIWFFIKKVFPPKNEKIVKICHIIIKIIVWRKNMRNFAIMSAHSEHSLKNATMSVKRYVSVAKELGYKYIALTDTDNMTGIIEFILECKKQNIKAIPGIEAVFDEELHSLILVAKNYKGFIQINKAFRLANENIYTDPDSEIKYPLFTYEILEECLNKQDVAIILPTQNSILSDIYLNNSQINTEISKLKIEQNKYPSPLEDSFIKNSNRLRELDGNISELSAKIKQIESINENTYVKKLCALEAIKDTEPDVYSNKKIALDKEILAVKEKKRSLKQYKKQNEELKRIRKALKLKLTAVKKKHKEYNSYQKQIDELKGRYISEEQIKTKVLEIVERLGLNFNLYFELSYHGRPEEKYIIKKYAFLSKLYGFPMIVSNSPRFSTKDDYKDYQILKSLEYNEWIPDNGFDMEMYVKSYDELAYSIKDLDLFDDKEILQIFNNTNELAENIDFIYPDCSLSENKHYPKYIDSEGRDAETVLKEKVKQGIIDRGFTKETFNQTYIDRMNYELEVIIKMGFSDYLLIVQDFIEYGKSLEKYGVGPGRGSDAGCLICFLLGITNIDPIKYNLKFERFLNINRVSMPDIDTDFSSAIRYKVADYVADKYGQETVAFIRTKMTQKGKNSVRNVARVFGVRDKNDKKAYLSIADSICKDLPSTPDFSLNDYKDVLLNKYTSDIEREIVNTANEIEGSMTTVSTHAAGVIIGDGKPLTEYVPVFYNPNMEKWTVSCDMIEAEEIGLLKMDFLGLKNLDIITETVKRVKKYKNIDLDLNNIPFEDEIIKNIYAEGQTASVFQFESKGMREMLKQFKPTSFEDIILLNAAYRPGPMDFLPAIIKSKRGEEEPYYCIPELKDILSSTYGYPIYQEQLIDIFSICAGFSQGEADNIRRYMSKKKTDKFMAYKEQFIGGLIKHGANDKDANNLWDSLVSFSEYAFNKSHATTYALVSYQTAYLKYYYPNYYMCAVLNNSDVNKLKSILFECKEMGINILLPDINRSFENFENTGYDIIYGYTRIKSVKNKITPFIEERKTNGNYTSFKDFVRRTRCSEKIINSLIKAGCFDSFRKGMRTSYSMAYNDIITILDNIDKTKDTISKVHCDLEDSKNTNKKKTRKRSGEDIKSLNELENSLKQLEYEYFNYAPSVDIEDDDAVLEEERELLGAYVSGHPLDLYDNYFKSGSSTLISDIEDDGNIVCAGIIKELRLLNRKTDNAEFASFILEDVSGSIEVYCFTKQYAINSKYIEENNVIEIVGEVFSDDNTKKVSVDTITEIKPVKNPIFISISTKQKENELEKILHNFYDDTGHPIVIHFQDSGELEYKEVLINKSFIYNAPDYVYANELYT